MTEAVCDLCCALGTRYQLASIDSSNLLVNGSVIDRDRLPARFLRLGGLGGTTGSASDSRSEGRGFDSQRSVFHSCQVNRLG